MESYAVAVVVETPEGIPLVLDPQKPIPRFWKFPGGRNRQGEKPIETAARELDEETGICLLPNQLTLIYQEIRTNESGEHLFFLFRAKIPEKIGLSLRAKEKEFTAFFTQKKIETVSDFFPNHRSLLPKLKM